MTEKKQRPKLKMLDTRTNPLCAYAVGPIKCPNLAVDGSDYCEEHRRQMAQDGIVRVVDDGD